MKNISIFFLLYLSAFSANAAELNSADTAWILASSGLVLFVALPGLMLFYGGLVRTKNVLAIIMAGFSIVALISLIWAMFGYSLALTDGGSMQAVIGGTDQIFLWNLDAERLTGNLPESVFCMYQMAFAVLAPALIAGSLAERIKFFPLLFFCVLWELFVYVPICHWIWGKGWLAELGVMDFAGGIVVHGSAGIAALIGAMMIGPRRGFPTHPLMPHNLTMTVAGAGILWVGWHGFSAGSVLMSGGAAGMAMLSTHICASSASVTWVILDWLRFGKPSVLGAMTGMVAGLATIASGAGYISPFGALLIGIISGVACFYAIHFIKHRLLIDDALDVFPVHGVCGLLGALLTAVFADQLFGGRGVFSGNGMIHQFLMQLLGITVTLTWSAVVSYLLFKSIDGIAGLRASEEDEISGLDTSLHDQQGYNF